MAAALSHSFIPPSIPHQWAPSCFAHSHYDNRKEENNSKTGKERRKKVGCKKRIHITFKKKTKSPYSFQCLCVCQATSISPARCSALALRCKWKRIPTLGTFLSFGTSQWWRCACPIFVCQRKKRRERKRKNVPRFVVVIGSPPASQTERKEVPGLSQLLVWSGIVSTILCRSFWCECKIML